MLMPSEITDNSTRPAIKIYMYHKVPKFSDTRKFRCNLPKIKTKRPNLRVFCQKDGKANSEDPDQTRSSLFWVCTVCLDQLYVQKLRIITV